MTAVNAHTRLILIMARIANHLFSIKDDVPREEGFYRVKFDKIIKIENDLDEWFNSLQSDIDLNGPDVPNQIRFLPSNIVVKIVLTSISTGLSFD